MMVLCVMCISLEVVIVYCHLMCICFVFFSLEAARSTPAPSLVVYPWVMAAPPVERQAHAEKLPNLKTPPNPRRSERKKWGQQLRHERRHVKRCWRIGGRPWNRNPNRKTWKFSSPEKSRPKLLIILKQVMVP